MQAMTCQIGLYRICEKRIQDAVCERPCRYSLRRPALGVLVKVQTDKVTAFVSRISTLTKSNRTMLTAVIFPDRLKAMEVKQQDWRTWSALGYVDGFTPLLLTCDPATAGEMIKDVTCNKSACTKLYPGLFVTFMNVQVRTC